MISFGISLPDDTPQLDDDQHAKMSKYVSVFIDMTAYFFDIKQFTNLEIAMACVVCSRWHSKLDKYFDTWLTDLYGGQSEKFSDNVEWAADMLWDEYQSTLASNKAVQDSPVINSPKDDAKSKRIKLLSSKKMIWKSSVKTLLNVPNEPSLKSVAE